MTIQHIFKIFLFLAVSIIRCNSYAVLKPLDEIVVIVNNDVITRTMLQDRISDLRKQLDLEQNAKIDPKALRNQVLERMIRDQIQLQQARQFGIVIDDLVLNRMLEKLAKNNNMTLESFRDTLKAEGLNYSRFREQTRNEIIINQLQQRLVASKINVSEQEIAQHIKQSESSVEDP